MERITDSLLNMAASFFMCSEKNTPGVPVATVLNSPRYSAGASGLGSNVS